MNVSVTFSLALHTRLRCANVSAGFGWIVANVIPVTPTRCCYAGALFKCKFSMNYHTTHTVKMYGARITSLVCRRITSTVPQHHLAGALFLTLTLALSASFPKELPS